MYNHYSGLPAIDNDMLKMTFRGMDKLEGEVVYRREKGEAGTTEDKDISLSETNYSVTKGASAFSLQFGVSGPLWLTNSFSLFPLHFFVGNTYTAYYMQQQSSHMVAIKHKEIYI